MFFRHKQLLLISFFGIALAGVLYSIIFPSYKAEMKVLVRRGRIDPAITPTPSASPAFEHDEISEEQMNSEVELLRDGDILRQVVLETGLDKGNWLSRTLHRDSNVRIERAVRRLAEQLDVRPVRKSRLITISYSSSNPQRSSAVLRSLAKAYLAKHMQVRRPAGEQTFFEKQVEESRRGLDEAQGKLVAFSRQSGTVSAEVERNLVLQKLSDAEGAELGVESELAELWERAHALDAKLHDLPERRVMQIKNADNPQLQEKLKSKLLELELRRTQLLTKFQPSYRLVQEVDQQIAQTKAAIAEEDAKPLRDETTEENPEYEWAHSERLKNQIELKSLQRKEAIAREQVAAYRAAAEKLEEDAVAQGDLEQRVKSAEEKWLLYSNKLEEARIGDALDQNGVLNVALAEEPRTPALPMWSLWSAGCLSCLGAFGLSTGVVFAADYLDPSFRTPDEVMQYLGSPVLASLPINDRQRRWEAS